MAADLDRCAIEAKHENTDRNMIAGPQLSLR
jgi:hypothetical protein